MLATLASVSSANRIRLRLAKHHQIPSRVIQTPSSLTKEGCGYSLRFDDKYKNTVAQTAMELKINIRSFFQETTSDSGTVYIKE